MWAQVAPTAHEVYAGHCSPHFADGQTEVQGTRSTGLKSESQAVSKAETHTWHFHTVWLHLMKTSPSAQTHLRVINYTSENTAFSLIDSLGQALEMHQLQTSPGAGKLFSALRTWLEWLTVVSLTTGTWVWVTPATASLQIQGGHGSSTLWDGFG